MGMRRPPGFSLPRAISILALALGMATSCPAIESIVTRYNLVVVAPDRDFANAVGIEVEHAAERFHRAFGLSLTEPWPGPMIVVQVGVADAAQDEEGFLSLQSEKGSAKIRIRWAGPPLRRDALSWGTLRALALRHALANGARSLSEVPDWVLDGVAMLAMPTEVAEAECARAEILARLAPRLTFEAALGLLDGRVLAEDDRRGLAGALLIEATATKKERARLLAALPSFGVDPGAALAVVTGRTDVEAWWPEWWRKQSARLPSLRLSWKATRLWILAREKVREAPPAPEASIAPVAHPWFGPWFTAPPSVESSSLGAIRREIELRRIESLEWFDAIGGTGFDSRAEWLAEGRRGDSEGGDSAGRGPARQWFRSLNIPSGGAARERGED